MQLRFSGQLHKLHLPNKLSSLWKRRHTWILTTSHSSFWKYYGYHYVMRWCNKPYLTNRISLMFSMKAPVNWQKSAPVIWLGTANTHNCSLRPSCKSNCVLCILGTVHVCMTRQHRQGLTKQPKKRSQKIKEEKNISGLYAREKSTLSADLRKPTTIKSQVKFSSDPTDKKLSKQLHKKLLAAWQLPSAKLPIAHGHAP